ncbi:hypothetical protein TRFO_15516 [Tritrichomonas foetus]|uniref:Uncharacterized protein n=1 Tax=Tritrichomonas foetus TaxID=1144522 RepID=A0A1J4KTJ4_9EUKA|nr:hypothetical protein TRFO_15516 [Tritrichomonas foetus]|eukprot:OHT14216.1 hypothetical protein TRFO_15516 [Tritrichomonas foetus]
MPCDAATFAKVCRVVAPLVGIGDGLYLVFVYSDEYWLSIIGYKNLVLSLLLMLFSIGSFSASIVFFLVKKERKSLVVNLYSLSSIICFFISIILLRSSSTKVQDEAIFWIESYNQTYNESKLMANFEKQYPNEQINNYIRTHVTYAHDVLLLTLLIWVLFFVIFSFFSHVLIEYFNTINSNLSQVSRKHSFRYYNDENNEYVYEYEYYDYDDETHEKTGVRTRTRTSTPIYSKAKIAHVRSATKILRLVNMDSQPNVLQNATPVKGDNQNSEVSQTFDEKTDSDKSAKSIISRKNIHINLSDSYMSYSDEAHISAITSTSPRRSKTIIPKRLRRIHLDEPLNIDSDSILPEQNTSIDFSMRHSRKMSRSPRSPRQTEQVPARLRPLDVKSNTPKKKYNWDNPIKIVLSSSDSDSTSSLFNSYDSFGFFGGFHSSDSW